MLNASVENKSETQPFQGWLIVALVVIISIAVDGALLLGLASAESWIVSAAIIVSVVLIGAGTLFTAVKIRQLGGPRQEN